MSHTDLSFLSLFHVLRDKQGFVEEVARLQESQPIDDVSWQSIYALGRDLFPEDVLQKTLHDGGDAIQNGVDTRGEAGQLRRVQLDRREQDRRCNVIPWIGPQRRRVRRRLQARRRIRLE